MHVQLLFPSQYIRCADLRDRDVTLTIARVIIGEVRNKDGSERKALLFFREMERRKDESGLDEDNKRLILNKTNAKIIAGIHGNETDRWAGKKITLYPTTCSAFGEQVECIRIRPNAPAQNENANEEDAA